MAQRKDIQALIRTLDAQRAVLGDATIDFAIGAIREAAARDGSDASPPPTSSAPPHVEPKLRQVTILFCDIVDSTAMVQSLSPEDALQVIDPLLEAFANAVRKAEGRVLKFTGDGLMAAFGAETSREDDAERAVRTGLALIDLADQHTERVRRDFGITSFAIRTGINTGPVMLGGGVEVDSAAMGHAVHIAARMEQHAPVGALRILHGTWLHVRGLFEMEAQPPLAVKGSSEPLLTYLVRQAIAPDFRVANRGIEGVATPTSISPGTRSSATCASTSSLMLKCISCDDSEISCEDNSNH